jgi:nitroreductase
VQSLTADEVLTTTRAVRRRLDLGLPVERALLEQCLRIAQQAPSGSNAQPWHFVIVTDAEQRAELGRLYRELAETIMPRPETITSGYAERVDEARRVYRSAWFLAEHLGEVPVHVIPCVEWPRDEPPRPFGAGLWASVIQAAWSFMLAARARGLGTAWTALHLHREQEVAELLDIPYEQVRQVALIPVAHTKGGDFKAGPRQPLEDVAHWDRW